VEAQLQALEDRIVARIKALEEAVFPPSDLPDAPPATSLHPTRVPAAPGLPIGPGPEWTPPDVVEPDAPDAPEEIPLTDAEQAVYDAMTAKQKRAFEKMSAEDQKLTLQQGITEQTQEDSA